MTFNRHDEEAWPAPWASEHTHFIKRFGDVRHQYWSEPLVELKGGLPTPLTFDDPVLSGMARKAAQVMRNTCTACGRPGKVLRLGGAWAVRCGMSMISPCFCEPQSRPFVGDVRSLRDRGLFGT